MRRATQNRLYHVLPVVFWLLAAAGALVPGILRLTLPDFSVPSAYYLGFLVATLVMIIILFIGRIQRHTSSVEECLWVGLIIGVASYWLPTVVFLILPIWVYLIYQNLFSFRSFLATLIGLAVVAIYFFVGLRLGWLTYSWTAFFSLDSLWGWIPTGAALIAWLTSTIARQTLRVR